ncbi:ATP-binding protein [Herbivorax sp. ANBcel31]|uniref:AAA family ATPase n=1 Tax=Herbivorax sp. ANBcel31 TaxID=3069754 RepID=UPI0027B34E11|nr:ATP-binding protein [Herbivorax sp. ANBcel31]MDQ2087966.1 ATP-binding protein [Herbivorax sp. ANBcel31]
MSKVILICGKICSGKSYYANKIKEKENAVILSTDEVTYDLTDNEQGESYEKFANRVNAYLMKKAVELTKIGCNVIFDWGFWTKSNRQETTDYYKSKNINIEWHYIDIDDETWYKNIEYRNKKVLNGEGGSDFYVDEGLLNKVLSTFETPNRNEMDIWYRPDREINEQ